ncbi:MAG: phosphatase PAP2 family protein [Planctomycetota bacterium]
MPRAPWSDRVDAERVTAYVAGGAILIGVACLFDGWVFGLGRVRGDSSDLDRMFRVVGFVPTWLIIGGALALARTGRVKAEGWLKAMNAPLLIVLASAGAGAVAEVVKLLARRLRPRETGGIYEWRPIWEGGLDAGDMGFPSSHAMVAFGGAWMLCRLYPWGTPIWLALAIGCAVTRVMTHAHFVSDVTGSAVLAFAFAACLWNWHRFNESRDRLATEPVQPATGSVAR